MIDSTTYKIRNNEGEVEERVKANNPLIGQYLIRATKILSINRAEHACKWLNKMVKKREGIKDRFKIARYRFGASHIVVRKVLPDDLVSAINDSGEL